jgi:hypothetical protein
MEGRALIKGLIGNPAAWGAIIGGLGAFLWWHEHHWQRFTAWCFAVAAACWTVAIPPLFDALAALTASGSGRTVLGLLILFAGVTFYLQAIRTHKQSRFMRLLKGKPKPGQGGGKELALLAGGPPRKNRHRRIGTPVVSIITGALFVIVVGGWRLLLENAGTSAKGALAALAEQSKRVNNGKAAAAIPQSHRPEVYLVAGVAILVMILVMRSIEKRRHGGGKKPQQQRGGPQSLPAGRGNPAFGGQ